MKGLFEGDVDALINNIFCKVAGQKWPNISCAQGTCNNINCGFNISENIEQTVMANISCKP